MWIKTQDGNVMVNMAQMSFVTIDNWSYGEKEKFGLVAYGIPGNNEDESIVVTLFSGTYAECEAEMARLPMPIAYDLSRDEQP